MPYGLGAEVFLHLSSVQVPLRLGGRISVTFRLKTRENGLGGCSYVLITVNQRLAGLPSTPGFHLQVWIISVISRSSM